MISIKRAVVEPEAAGSSETWDFTPAATLLSIQTEVIDPRCNETFSAWDEIQTRFGSSAAGN